MKVIGDDDDEFLNRLVERNHEFQEMLRQRDAEKLRGETLTHEDLRRELLSETV